MLKKYLHETSGICLICGAAEMWDDRLDITVNSQVVSYTEIAVEVPVRNNILSCHTLSYFMKLFTKPINWWCELQHKQCHVNWHVIFCFEHHILPCRKVPNMHNWINCLRNYEIISLLKTYACVAFGENVHFNILFIFYNIDTIQRATIISEENFMY